MALLSREAVAFLKERATLRLLLLTSLVFRVCLLVYGEWQDARFPVKFTDIDYQVFSDAAGHVIRGESPFARATYRYTPLVAFLLVPNHFLLFSFGKLLFIFSDMLVGWLIREILRLKGVKQHQRLLSVMVWLLNPLTATVSARGNAESLLAVLVLSSLLFLLHGQLSLSAVAFGAAVHFKIFPVIYSLPVLLFLDKSEATHSHAHSNPPQHSHAYSNPRHSNPLRSHRAQQLLVGVLERVRRFPNVHQLKFVSVSVVMFLSLTGLFYHLYGNQFIHEAYLYHVTRRDTKHNFSAYFYLLYLIQGSYLSLPVALLAFLPQAALLVAISLCLHRDIVFCCFVQTFVFVTFNKVCTSQYFLWYLCLLPLILPFSKMTLQQWTLLTVLWFTGQGVWLSLAYCLEFQGLNTFLPLWISSLLFLLINVFILSRIITHHILTPVTHSPSHNVAQMKERKLR